MIRDAHILITGGLGAIGSNLCRALLEAGAGSILVLDDASSSMPHAVEDVLQYERVWHVRKSIADDEALRKVFLDVPPSIVFHLAAHFANQNSIEHPVADTLVNSLGTVKVLEYARMAGVKKFIFASSSCVYGNKENFSVDTLNYHLDTPYAINKLHGEYLVKFYHEFHGMNTTILRYFNSFGPGELPGPYRNVVPNFFFLAMRGQSLPLTGDPAMTRDFNYVDNVVQATMLAVETPKSTGQVYNVGSGQETTIGALAEKINTLTQNTAGITRKERRPWDTILRRKADISKTVADLGYEPVVDMDAHLEATYVWLKRMQHLFPPSLQTP